MTLPIAVAMVVTLSSGCNRDARLAGRKLRDPKIRTVTYYDIKLDQDASPEQVAFVLLRAMRDDFLAKTDADREKAMDIQFDLCAADYLAARHQDSKVDRLEMLYRIVSHWTPTVSYYVGDIDTDWQKAKAQFVKLGPNPLPNSTDGAQQCQVVVPFADPGGDPNASVLLAIHLVQDGGYWRVLKLSFVPRARALPQRAGASPGTTDSTSGGDG